MSDSDFQLGVGTTLGVVLGEPATYDAAGFGALTFADVAEVSEIPQLGGSGTVAEFIRLASGVVSKQVGSINYGEITIPMAAVWSDAGYAALKAGFDGTNARKVHSFEIAHPTVGTLYFTGVISGVQYTPGDANTAYTNSVTVSITDKVIED